MSAESKAVFLSYASQDAEVAGRICHTLRRGGVELERARARCARTLNAERLTLNVEVGKPKAMMWRSGP
jgi:hypothetical protein